MTEVIDKKPDVVAQLKLDEKPHPEERWEGVFTLIDSDDQSTMNLQAVARLRFGGGLLEGAGRMSYEGRHVIDMTVTGEVAGDVLTFDTWIDSTLTAEARHGDLPTFQGRLSCSAELNSDGDKLDGTFSHGCISPEICGSDCKGGSGELHLVRVAD